MSATNRGKEKLSQEHYVTPAYTIYEMLEKCKELDIHFDDYNDILDPCAGGNKFIDRSCNESSPNFEIVNYPPYPEAIKTCFNEKIFRIITIDIREDAPVSYRADYLKMPLLIEKFDLIISNPPFSLFMQFVEKSYEDIKENGYIIFLLRLNALGSQKRRLFWQMYPPKYCLVHSKRPSFMPGGGTDATEYAHFIWQKGYVGPTLTYVI